MADQPPDRDDYYVAVTQAAAAGGQAPGSGDDSGSRRAMMAAVLGLVALGVLVATTLVTGLLGRPPSHVRAATAAASADGYAVWATNPDGTPVRWNPCEPIRWVLYSDGAPADARAQIEAAMEHVTAASGIGFRFAGPTGEVPGGDRAPYQPDSYGDDRWAPVLIAWVPAASAAVPLESNDRAVAIPVAVERGGTSTFVGGQIVMNADVRTGLRDPRASWHGTLLHELGHLVGLDHVDDPTQVMYPYPGNGPRVLGDGDRAGLAAVGVDHGCLAVPRPGHVEVTYVDDFGH